MPLMQVTSAGNSANQSAPAAAGTLVTTALVPTQPIIGPGNWKTPNSMTNLGARERHRYRLLYDTATLIQDIHRNLPDYKNANRFTSARWLLIHAEFVRRRSPLMAEPTNSKSLAATYHAQKLAMNNMTAVELTRSGPPTRVPLPGNSVRIHGGKRKVGTSTPVSSRVNGLDVMAQWADFSEGDDMTKEEAEAIDEEMARLFDTRNNPP